MLKGNKRASFSNAIPAGMKKAAVVTLATLFSLGIGGGLVSCSSGSSSGGNGGYEQPTDDDTTVDDDSSPSDDDTTPVDDDDTSPVDDDSVDDDTVDDDNDDDSSPTLYEACFNVSSFLDGADFNKIKDITVNLEGAGSCDTDELGNCCIPGIDGGKYWVSFKDLQNRYIGSQAGNLNVDASHAGSLEKILYKLLPQDKLSYIKDTMYFDGNSVEKWTSKPKFVLYTKDNNGGTNISDSKLDIVRGVILDQLNEFVQDQYTFADADIEFRNTTYDGNYQDGEFIVYWDSSSAGGGNWSAVNDGKINVSEVNVNPNDSQLATLALQEQSAALVNGAETQDTDNFFDSCFYDPYYVRSLTNYSEEDLMFSRATYGIFSRPPLNHLDESAMEEVSSDTYNLN
jgi:hypothetical protein